MIMAWFLASEAAFFGFLILAYIYYRNAISSGPTAKSSLDPSVTAIYTVLLIASSGTVWIAQNKLKANRRSDFRGWLLVTVALGAIFLVGQGLEYARLLRHDVTISRNLFGSSFFTLTGFHGLHVLIGLAMLTTMLGMAWFSSIGSKEWIAFESIALYWHFVDVVWIVIFSIIYLGALL